MKVTDQAELAETSKSGPEDFDTSAISMFMGVFIALKDRFFQILLTIEPQWPVHIWDHGNSFETWVVRATEG